MSIAQTHIYRNRFTNKDVNFQQRLQERLENQHFLKHIGFEFTVLEAGYTQGQANIQTVHLQNIGFFHGGLIATAADVLMGFAASSLLYPDVHVVTADLRISFLNPGVGNRLIGAGWVIKPGSRLYFCEAELYCENGDKTTLIAKASATMSTVSKV